MKKFPPPPKKKKVASALTKIQAKPFAWVFEVTTVERQVQASLCHGPHGGTVALNRLSHSTMARQWQIIVWCNFFSPQRVSRESSRSFLFVWNLCQWCKLACSNPSLASLGWSSVWRELTIYCTFPTIYHSDTHPTAASPHSLFFFSTLEVDTWLPFCIFIASWFIINDKDDHNIGGEKPANIYKCYVNWF